MSVKLTQMNEKKSDLISKKGKKARERLSKLFDAGTFIETEIFFDAGVITGFGQVDGRLVYAFASEDENDGGAVGKEFADKVNKCQNDAIKAGVPIVYINDSIGAKLLDGAGLLSSYARVMKKSSEAKGMVPQLTINFAKNVGVSSILSEMGDFTFSLSDKDSDFVANSEDECFEKARKLLTYFPQNNMDKAESTYTNDDINRVSEILDNIVPADDKAEFDISVIIKEIADNYDFFEVKEEFAKNIIVGFARLGGDLIGIVANNSKVKNGILDRDAVDKAVKFIETCDLFGVPVLTLVDTDASTEKYVSELVNVYSISEVPLVTLLVRRAYGNGYLAMCPKGVGADLVFAYPDARIGVMKPVALANILYEKEISAVSNVEAERTKYINELSDSKMSPSIAASIGIVDDVIEPSATRQMLISAFDMLKTKKV